MSESDLISRILEERRRDARAAKSKISVAELEAAARKRRHRSMASGLSSASRPYIIAEMKKASPSAGLLRDHYEPETIAGLYAASGASAVSVLTEPGHFLGSIEDLERVRRSVACPILRKDFIGDAYQVYESAARGADVILLIVAALDREILADLYDIALSLGLEVLMEAHSEEELDAAVEFPRTILGINNRNLATLVTDLSIGRRLAGRIPAGRPAVIESGIRTPAEVRMFRELGYAGFLIGEVLMRSAHPDLLLREMAGGMPPGNSPGGGA
ncbi:MAG: indole-3-glycerol phosphate synthase TrpC [Candidatus Aminicenantales bacterium]